MHPINAPGGEMGDQAGGFADAVAADGTAGRGGGGPTTVGAERRPGRRRGLRACTAGLIAVTGGLLGAGAVSAPAESGVRATAGREVAAAKGRVAEAYGRLPLAFEPNRGQAAAGIRYLAHGPGYGVFITADRTVVTLAPHAAAKAGGRAYAMRTRHLRRAERDRRAVLSFRAVGGAADPVIAGGSPLAGRVNYLRGRDRAAWRTNIPTYREVTERGVYRGVDLRWYGTRQGLEYDVTVAPGVDPGKVRFAIGGLRARPHLTGRGDLVLPTALGDVVQRAPQAYQVVNGRPRPVAARFTLAGADQVGFALADHDRGRPLIIDPRLDYSTYLGGTGYDEGNGIVVDSAGSAYVTGDTNSADFPVERAVQRRLRGGFDTFITKLDPTGTALVYSTYLGGSGEDLGIGIALDSAGAAYVTGETDSDDFPVTSGAFQTGYHGNGDAFVTKLDPSGGALAYSTYLGGGENDQADGIGVDASGDAYVAGYTYSGDFPRTTGPSMSGGTDAFAARLGPTGGTLLYSRYLGGSDYTEADGLAVDASGNAYLTGLTASSDFPTTAGAVQGSPGGALDAFVTELSPADGALIYSTYLGGTGSELGYEIAVGSSGNAYVTGVTDSTDFPTTAGAFQTTFRGGYTDAFVTALGPTGGALVYSTYLGGARDDQGDGIAVDASGDAFVTGATDSRNFPATTGALQPAYGGGGSDAYVTEFDPAGSAPVHSTYIGGTAYDEGDGIAVDASGSPYLTGVTDSRNFPRTSGAFQTAYGGGIADAFVLRPNLAAPAPTPATAPRRVSRRQRESQSQQARHRQAGGGNAVADNTNDSAVTGNVRSGADHVGVDSARSRLHRLRRGHSYRRTAPLARSGR
ncbi:SBBP repeat-containing protein [Actinoallomurus spadix]|uniref:SBBP repeat-containing protein n=1 Tax=Actinoallomurus spadix TaxID=79912 RepID=A0ABN0WMF9_9ACTN|nr:SBBP repeat-containing protein [Actinoallomurus spadix]MCO5984579.1 SBBP repeat-containing protein [Actinoallomurus spadix]